MCIVQICTRNQRQPIRVMPQTSDLIENIDLRYVCGMHKAMKQYDSRTRTLPEHLIMRCTRITPTSEAPMQHSPKTSANCRFSWWLKPKDKAADEDVKRTMSVEVAAAACG